MPMTSFGDLFTSSKGKENTEIGSRKYKNVGKFLRSGNRYTEMGSTQMKNPGEFILFSGSGIKNTENTEIQKKNPGQFNLFSGSGMENTEIGSRQTKNVGEFSFFSKLCIKNLEIGSSQMKTNLEIGSSASTGDDLSHCSSSMNKYVSDRLCKDGLKRFADNFRSEYIYSSGIERKTCIGSDYTYSWDGNSSRIMWVGVHGNDSICVVTRDIDRNMIRLSGGFNRHGIKATSSYFRRTLISEIEYLADPDTYSALRPRFDKGIEKPFGLVSVIPRTNEVHKVSGHEVSNDEYVEKLMFLGYELERIQPPTDEKIIIEFEKIKRDTASAIIEARFQASSKAEHDEKKAIEFLQEKMKSNMAFTVNETIQTAISAFQHLFQKKFKANEIKVSVIDPNYLITPEEEKYKDPYVKELEISDIEEHLAVINKALEAEALVVEGRQSTTEEYVRSGFICVGEIHVQL